MLWRENSSREEAESALYLAKKSETVNLFSRRRLCGVARVEVDGRLRRFFLSHFSSMKGAERRTEELAQARLFLFLSFLGPNVLVRSQNLRRTDEETRIGIRREGKRELKSEAFDRVEIEST